jgi:ribosomal-protein-alanine N-acetyltransferase
MNIQVIATPRLVLRGLTRADTDSLQSILNDPEVLHFFPNPEPPGWERVQKIIDQQLIHWQEHGYGWWAVELRSSQELIGWAGLQFLPDTSETEVAYLLGKAYWGQGFATEAARASMKFGFETLKLNSIVAVVHPANKASIRVIEKLGMTFIDHTYYFEMEVYHYSLNVNQKID